LHDKLTHIFESLAAINDGKSPIALDRLHFIDLYEAEPSCGLEKKQANLFAGRAQSHMI